MSSIISCPSCGKEFELSEIMEEQLKSQLEAELKAEYTPKLKAIEDKEKKIAQAEQALQEAQRQVDAEVTKRLAEKSDALRKAAFEQAKQDLNVELKDKQQQVDDLQAKVTEAQNKEVEFKKKERLLLEQAKELEASKAGIQSEILKGIAAERQKISEAAREQAHSEFEIELKDRDQQVKQLQSQLNQAKEKELELRHRERKIAEEQTQLQQAKEDLQAEMKTALEAERLKISQEAKRKAGEEFQVLLQQKDSECQEYAAKLKQSKEAELDLLKQKRELEDAKADLELEVERTLSEERGKIRLEAQQKVEDEFQFKLDEKQKVITDLVSQLQEAKRKAEQGSQQLQGEVQELALEDLLKSAFPNDKIVPVGKGVKGADVVQYVTDPLGAECGSILWESKRTKTWQSDWIVKAKDEQRAIKAECCVIISQVLPSDIRTFTQLDGVWVGNWHCILGIAAALRFGIAECYKAQKANEGKQSKMELVYSYLTSPDFGHRVRGIIEPFMAMQKDLEGEKRAYQKIWAKREKQLQRAVLSTNGLYGDLQGLFGKSLPELNEMKLIADESNDEE